MWSWTWDGMQVPGSETALLERLIQWLESYFAGIVTPQYTEDGVRQIATLLAPEWQFVALKKRPAVDERWHVLVRFLPEDAYFAFSFQRPMHAHNMVLRPETIRLVF